LESTRHGRRVRTNQYLHNNLRLAAASYRGLRFGFDGTLIDSYKTFAMWPAVAIGIVVVAMMILPGFPAILSMFVVPALVPFIHYQIKRYQHNYSRFGKTRFSFHATPRDFYMAYAARLLRARGHSPILLTEILERLEADHRGTSAARTSDASSNKHRPDQDDEEESDGFDLLSAHPGTACRAARLRAL